MLIFITSVIAPLSSVKASSIDELQRSFVRPPDDSKIMMRWWWFGPAVDKVQLEREMRQMKEGGIGGFEVQPVYALSLDDPSKDIKNLRFLSDEFIDALKFTSEKAREMGLRMDLTLGSGWPFGGPQISINHAASALKIERVKVDGVTRRVPIPNIGAGDKLLGAFLVRAQDRAVAADSIRELTDIKDGAVWLPANAEGANEVQFFVSSRTGMQVKRPSVGAEGFVLDHLNRAATDHYLKTVGDRLMQAFGNNPPYAIFCDSLEVYNQDWADDFLEEFRKRRGYDLKPLLPALASDIGPKTADIRHDWGKTLTELLNERFLAPMQDWSKRNRALFRIQNYGIPPAAISSNVYSDLPEGEGPQWKVVRASRWASSASHLYGRPVTSSETWTWLHSPVFRATPLDMKAEADLHFLQGINQLIGHGWPYTPEKVEYPGWRFYAAAVFNEKNPWWAVMPDISLYLQRVSYLMRQGKPANDVALYLPNSDAWASFTPGRVHLIETQRELLGHDIMPRILESGYNLDFFDDGALEQVGRVEKNALVLGQNKYRIVVLPGVERIPLNTLKKLDEFVRGGGILIATRRIPKVAPGLQTTESEKAEIREIAQRLFEGANPSARFVEDENQGLVNTLKKGLQPDMSLAPSVADIGFIHRKTDDADIYFVANTSNNQQKVNATFRVEGLQPELWNPMTGEVSTANVQATQGGMTIALDLEPYSSRVLVFSKRSLPKTKTENAPNDIPSPMDLSNNWQVTFGQNGAPIQMEILRSWTDTEETKYFSGTSIYEKTINVPESFLRNGLSVRLDFGEGKPIPLQPVVAGRPGMRAWFDAPVREAAIVYVNGNRAGSVWCPPYSIELSGLLKNGENTIRILVSNLAINYMAGRKLPDYRLLNLRYGERFQAQDMDKVQPITAGLLGPIRLIPSAKSDRK
jgi:hypothetical protein